MLSVPNRPRPDPIKRSPQYGLRRNVFRAFSPKAERYLTFYSAPEYRHWILREADPAVQDVCEEPLEIKAQHDGLRVRLTFSLWVRLWDGSELYYDTPAAADFGAANARAPRPTYWDVVETWSRANNLSCAFVHPDELRSKKRFIQNWIQALPYVQRVTQRSDGRIRRLLLEALTPAHRTTLAQLEQRFPEVQVDILHANVFFLIHAGKLRAPMDVAPISRHMPVELADD